MTNYLEGEVHRPGRIEVVCGSMFSGKTEELIRRLKRAKFARQRVEIFKPSIDTRYSEEEVVSHDQNAILSTPSSHRQAFCCWLATSTWWASTRHSSSTKGLSTYATNWPIVACASSWPDSTWTSGAFLSVPSPPCAPLPTK